MTAPPGGAEDRSALKALGASPSSPIPQIRGSPCPVRVPLPSPTPPDSPRGRKRSAAPPTPPWGSLGVSRGGSGWLGGVPALHVLPQSDLPGSRLLLGAEPAPGAAPGALPSRPSPPGGSRHGRRVPRTEVSDAEPPVLPPAQPGPVSFQLGGHRQPPPAAPPAQPAAGPAGPQHQPVTGAAPGDQRELGGRGGSPQGQQVSGGAAVHSGGVVEGGAAGEAETWRRLLRGAAGRRLSLIAGGLIKSKLIKEGAARIAPTLAAAPGGSGRAQRRRSRRSGSRKSSERPPRDRR